MSQQINLYNPDFEAKKKFFGAVALAQALVVLVLGVLALTVYAQRSVAELRQQADAGAARVAKKKAQLAMVAVSFAPRTRSPELESEVADAESQLASLRRITEVVDRGELGNATGYSEYFKALARQHVDGLWLTALAITGAGCEIGVRGKATDPSLLPGFLGRLTQEKIMQGKTFGSMQITQPAPVQAAPDAKDAAKEAKPAIPGYVEFSLQSKPEGAQS